MGKERIERKSRGDERRQSCSASTMQAAPAEQPSATCWPCARGPGELRQWTCNHSRYAPVGRDVKGLSAKRDYHLRMDHMSEEREAAALLKHAPMKVPEFLENLSENEREWSCPL